MPLVNPRIVGGGLTLIGSNSQTVAAQFLDAPLTKGLTTVSLYYIQAYIVNDDALLSNPYLLYGTVAGGRDSTLSNYYTQWATGAVVNSPALSSSTFATGGGVQIIMWGAYNSVLNRYLLDGSSHTIIGPLMQTGRHLYNAGGAVDQISLYSNRASGVGVGSFVKIWSL